MPATLHPDLDFPVGDERNIIWRYMDLAKFHSLLKSQSLWMSRRDRLGDPFEGSIHTLTHRHIDQRHYEAQLTRSLGASSENVRATLREMRTWQFANCWNRSPEESMALWQIYGHAGNTVAVRSTLPHFIEAVTLAPHSLALVPVTYERWWRQAWYNVTPTSLPQLKHKSYEHENEVRLLFDVKTASATDGSRPTDVGFRVPVDLYQLVKGVVLSPNVTSYFRDAVNDLMAIYLPSDPKIPVASSQMHGEAF